MTEIYLGVVLFTVIVLTLVAVILFARSKLVATGDVQILINNDPVRKADFNTFQCLGVFD